jgi:glutaredoxin
MRYLLIVCLALASTLASAQAYRYVDPQGRTVISDTPPPGRARDVAKSSTGGDNSDGLPYEVRRAVENFPVTLYTSADCVSECKQAREFLNGRGVPFTEKMVQKQEDIDELKRFVGDTFIPSLKVGKQSFRGFEPAAYTNLLDLAGYPKSAAYGSKPSGGLAK